MGFLGLEQGNQPHGYMKILLVGKYPPIQGGMASKAYWLCRSLDKMGFQFRIVTYRPEKYSVKGSKDDSKGIVVNEKEPPWHIPSSSLVSDRLLNASLKIAESFSPDIIETNYLWPFCNVAVMISQLLKKPLLIRHAGSDIQKFQGDSEFREIMSLYFRSATLVATNITAKQLVEEISANSAKVLCVPRYMPDPEIFKQTRTAKVYDILLAGKINYHWKRKGIMHLFEIIKKRNLTALFHIDGKYVNEVVELISSRNLQTNIRVASFVAPDEMPHIYNICKYVWCWDKERIIDDFSNVIWESLFSGVPCIVNADLQKGPEIADAISNFPYLVQNLSQEDIDDFEFRDSPSLPSDTNAAKSRLFNDYIRANIGVYQEVLRKSA